MFSSLIFVNVLETGGGIADVFVILIVSLVYYLVTPGDEFY